LVGVPGGELRFDGPAEAVAGPVAGPVVTVTVSLGAEPTGELMRAMTGALTSRPEEVLLTALARTLTGWTGAARHVVDVERTGREPLFEDVDVSRTVGPFSLTHPLALTGDASLEATLKTVKETLRAVPEGGIGWSLLRTGLPESSARLRFAYLDAGAPS